MTATSGANTFGEGLLLEHEAAWLRPQDGRTTRPSGRAAVMRAKPAAHGAEQDAFPERGSSVSERFVPMSCEPLVELTLGVSTVR